MNFKRLRKLRNHIAANTDRFHYGFFVGTADEIDLEDMPHNSPSMLSECGTLGCVAGWAAFLFTDCQDANPSRIADVAAEALGLEDQYFNFLCYCCSSTELGFPDCNPQDADSDEALRRLDALLALAP